MFSSVQIIEIRLGKDLTIEDTRQQIDALMLLVAAAMQANNKIITSGIIIIRPVFICIVPRLG